MTFPAPHEDRDIGDAAFVAFDIETTGLIPGMDRIVEIGAIGFDQERVRGSFQELVDPGMPIPPEAQALGGITDGMVRGKSGIEDVLPRFIDFVGDAFPVAHNAPFDVSFLAYDMSRLGFTAMDTPVFDTCALIRKTLPQRKSYGLGSLSRDLGIDTNGFHRALADAEVSRELFLLALSRRAVRGKVTVADLVKMSGPSLDFAFHAPSTGKRVASLKASIERAITVEIVYQDWYGSPSVRRITPLSIGLRKGKVVVDAFCHSKGENRTFRVDRICEIRR